MTTSSASPLTFASWTAALSARGLRVLPSSHVVPVEIWARDQQGSVLHFRARGTSVTLRRYEASDLTGLILRSECDCEEHRVAGAGQRTVLRPGAVPSVEQRVDGATEFGWSSFEAGLIDVPTAAALFDRLLGDLTARSKGPGTVVVPGPPPMRRRHANP